MSDGIMTDRAISYMRWKLEWEARFLLSNIDKLEVALRTAIPAFSRWASRFTSLGTIEEKLGERRKEREGRQFQAPRPSWLTGLLVRYTADLFFKFTVSTRLALIYLVKRSTHAWISVKIWQSWNIMEHIFHGSLLGSASSIGLPPT